MLLKARTRAVPWRRLNNNFNNRRFAAAKEIANARERTRNQECRFKIRFVLLQGKNIEVKHHDNVVRQMRVRRRAIFPASVRERQYPRN